MLLGRGGKLQYPVLDGHYHIGGSKLLSAQEFQVLLQPVTAIHLQAAVHGLVDPVGIEQQEIARLDLDLGPFPRHTLKHT